MTLDELFALDPADFVKARDALVKELRAQGKRDESAAVKGLRRPTVPAWALNQVSREHPHAMEALLDAADAARRAQDDVLAGADGVVLRDAMSDRRTRARAVVRGARDVLERSARSPDTYERELEDALNAIVDAPDLADAFRRGQLSDVRVAPEQGDDDLSSLLAASAAMAPERDDDAAARERAETRAAEERAARERVAEAQEALERAHADLERARDAVAVAKEVLREAKRARPR